MAYVPDATVAALRGNSSIGIFFRLGTSPALHLAFGINDIPILNPAVDPAGTVYLGGGRFLDVPALETLINGTADKVTFSLSGIEPAIGINFLDTAPSVLGAPVSVGIAPMDSLWQPMSNIVSLWTGVADFVAEEMKPEADMRRPRVLSFLLACSAGDTSRALPNFLTFTPQAQRLVAADDTFCNWVTRYVQTYRVVWPRY